MHFSGISQGRPKSSYISAIDFRLVWVSFRQMSGLWVEWFLLMLERMVLIRGPLPTSEM